MTDMFAGYPAPFVHAKPDRKSKKVQQLLWGDWVNAGPVQGDWTEVIKARNSAGWIRTSDLQPERILEVNFVDVGQGDGIFVVTPDDRRLLVDAGRADNMYWFLRWRFNLANNPTRKIHFDHAIITHSDADHYAGFASILESPQFTFGSLQYNGIVERAGDDPLGPIEVRNGQDYVTAVATEAELRTLLDDPAVIGRRQYPRMLRKALDDGRVGSFRMISANDGHLAGYDTGDLRIEVLAPVADATGGRPALRTFDDEGQTKNGHSVVLRIRYHGVRILLSGDLNSAAENHLLEHYTHLDPEVDANRSAIRDAARTHFEADVAKACHHGSADFTILFLECINALASIVSSGDNEPYAHPRPEAVGALGKYGRGALPLVFSTELARSANEHDRRPEALRPSATFALAAARTEIEESGSSNDERPGKAVASYQRAIAVYGLINVRTDGHRVVIAQKLERSSAGKEWDYHCLEPGAGGDLAYNPDR